MLRRMSPLRSLPLDAVLDSLPDGITVLDGAGVLVYANRAAAAITGVGDPRALIGATPEDIRRRFESFEEDGAPIVFEALPSRLALAGIDVPERVVRFRLRDTGFERWAVVRSLSVRNAAGQITHSVNSFRDITEERRLAIENKVAQEWFATALRSIGDAVIATDAEGRVTFMNAIAEQLTGWAIDDAAGHPLAEVFVIVNETTRKPVESPVDKVIAEGRVVGIANHTVLIARGGAETPIDDSAAPIRDPDGRLVGVILVFRDVGDKRREEARRGFIARASTELSSSIDFEATLAKVVWLAVPEIADWAAVDLVIDGQRKRLAVAHVDPDKIRFVEEIERRYPPDPNAANGTPRILRTGEPEMFTHIPFEMIARAVKDAEHLELARRLELCSYIGVPLKSRGQTMGVVTFAMAESKRHHDEADLALAMALADRASVAIENARLFREATAARAEAERANRSKDEFLAMLGHELRNPLAPILTALELMRLRPGDAHQRERQVIERQLKHIMRLVDDLLDVSRITRGKIALEHRRVELADLIANAIEQASPLFETRRHTLNVDVPEGLALDGDPVRLAQVFANLLTNAAKYTEPGGAIDVGARVIGDEVEVRVRDNGIGISTSMLPCVFDLFAQGEQGSDRAQGGLGLGLALVKRLVELHGGRVSAHSDGPGTGSEFRVVLRLLGAAKTDDAAPTWDLPARDEAGKRVLVVDDNADAGELLAMALEAFGYVATVAHDGPAALKLCENGAWDVGLFDIGLPVMDGYELAARVRATRSGAAMKLVALTGYGQVNDRSRALAAGFDGHLVKPVDIGQVCDEIERLTN